MFGTNGGSLDQSKVFDDGFTRNGIDIREEDRRLIHSLSITNAMSGPVNEGEILVGTVRIAKTSGMWEAPEVPNPKKWECQEILI